MVERFVQVGDELLAVLSHGTLLSTRLASIEWRQILPEVANISAVAAMQN
jgi:hypothetical protein